MKRLLLFFASVVAFLSLNAAEPTVVFSENFSAFTEGSESEPGTTDISSGYSSKLSKTLTGWSGKYVYEAGGMLKIGDGGKIVTSRYNLSANSGIMKIALRVRSLDETGMLLKVSIGYSTSKSIIISDNTWQDIEFITAGGSSYSNITIEPSLAFNGMLIDSIAVTKSEDYFPAPVVTQPSKADGKSFTAVWKSVSGAKAYLLDVYTKKSDTEFEYTLKDDTVKTTSKAITGLDESKTYFYRVRATNGTAISDYSDEIQVVKVLSSIDAPVALAGSNITANGFTANWNPVADAYMYAVNVYNKTTLAETGEVNLLEEDFSGVTIGTLTSVEFGSLSGNLDKYTSLPGWYAENPAFAAGYLVLAPFGSGSIVTTPYFDLSSSNGAFSAIINMAEMNYGTTYSGDTVIVSLIDANGSAIEAQEVVMKSGFENYTVNFTKGAANTAVKVTYAGSKKIFIDNFTIKQVLPAGYVLTSLEQTIETEETSANVTTQKAMTEDGSVAYAYTVEAIGQTVSSGEIVDIYSDPSNTIDVKIVSSAGELNSDDASVKAYRSSAKELTVNTVNPCDVQIFDITGKLLNTATLPIGTTTLPLSTNGLVIVKIGNKVVKL